MDVTVVAVASLDTRFRELRLAAPAQLSRLRTSVERDGIRNPLLVSSGIEAGCQVLVDGFKRVRVLRELGTETAPAIVLDLDQTAAQVAMVQCNVPHRGLSDLEEAWIVRSLCRQHHLPQVTVGKLLARDKSWVCRRLQLAERLDPEVQDEIRLGLVSVSVARELARLPRGNQVPVMQALRRHGLSSRQTAWLVGGLLGTDDPAARRDLLEDPLRYFPAPETEEASAASDPRLGRGGNVVRKSLLFLRGAALRFCDNRDRHAPAGLTGDEAQVLAPTLAEALRAVVHVVDDLRQLAADSGLLAPAEANDA